MKNIFSWEIIFQDSHLFIKLEVATKIVIPF